MNNIGHLLFSPNGRIGQQDFWIGILILIVGNVILGMIPFIGFIVSLGLIWVGIAVYGKRLHDAGKSAWLHAIPWGLSILLTIIGSVMFGGALFASLAASGEVEPAAILAGGGGFALMMMLGFVVWAAYTIWVGVLKPDEGDNRFGAAPNAPPAAPPSAAAPAEESQPADETRTD